MRAMTLALAFALVGALAAMPQVATGASPAGGDEAWAGVMAGAPFDVDLRLSAFGRFQRDGSAVVLGTVTCSRRAEFAWVEVMLRQRAGRRHVFGWGFRELVPCRKRPTDLRIAVAETDGVFRGGRAQLQAYVAACRRGECVEDFTERAIRLKGSER